MNIHEHQAKALLQVLWRCRLRPGVAIFTADEAEAAAKSLPGPLYVVKSQIHAGGRGKGKFKELRRRRQGRRAARQVGRRRRRQRQGDAGQHARHQADRRRPASRSTASISRTAPTSPASSTARCWSTAATGRVAFVVSTEGGMDIEAVAHDTPEKIITVAIDPVAGVTAADVAEIADGAEARRRGARGCEDAVPDALQGLHRQGHEPARGQSADRHDGRPSARARRQGVVRQQRAVPPSRARSSCAT